MWGKSAVGVVALFEALARPVPCARSANSLAAGYPVRFPNALGDAPGPQPWVAGEAQENQLSGNLI